MQQYKEIFYKLIPQLHKIYGQQLEQVILYGSVARGMDVAESDIDVAVIVDGYTKEQHDEMIEVLVDLELEYDKVISVVLIDYTDYNKWKNVLPFYKNVQKDGITLWKAA